MIRRRMTAKERLTRRLHDALLDLLPQGTKVSEPEIYPVRGYWTHAHQDVKQWDGWVRIDNADCSIGSWDCVTNCLRRGFEIVDHRGSLLARVGRNEVDIEVFAKDPKR